MREALRIAVAALGCVALFFLMQAPTPTAFSAPDRFYQPAPPNSGAPKLDIALSDAGDGQLDIELRLRDIELTEICSDDATGRLQGHAHVFINGRKFGQLFLPALRISGLAPGEHEITVAISRPPTHKIVTVNGEPLSVAKRITLTTPRP